jgi:hypothetical protein
MLAHNPLCFDSVCNFLRCQNTSFLSSVGNDLSRPFERHIACNQWRCMTTLFSFFFLLYFVSFILGFCMRSLQNGKGPVFLFLSQISSLFFLLLFFLFWIPFVIEFVFNFISNHPVDWELGFVICFCLSSIG